MEVKRWLFNHGRSATRSRKRRKATLGRYERRSERIITLHTRSCEQALLQSTASNKHRMQSEIMATAFLSNERVGDSKALLNEFPCYY
jgi:hypothetical protein